MICEECQNADSLGRLGFQGDPPAEAEFLVTITGPRDAAEANAPQVLCTGHAQLAVEAYLGYGWGVHADPLEPDPNVWMSSLVSIPVNAITGG